MKLETYMQKQSKNLDLLHLPFMENIDILNGQWEIAFNSLTLQEWIMSAIEAVIVQKYGSWNNSFLTPL